MDEEAKNIRKAKENVITYADAGAAIEDSASSSLATAVPGSVSDYILKMKELWSYPTRFGSVINVYDECLVGSLWWNIV